MGSYNTGTTWQHANVPAATANTGTLPSGILAGDVMLLFLNNFTYSGGSPAYSTPTSGSGGSTSWTRIGSIITGSQGSILSYCTMWYAIASATDASSSFTMSFTGTNGSTNGYWWTNVVVVYTGFYAASPVGAIKQPAATSGTSVVAGTITTARSGSWVIQACPVPVTSSGSISASPATNRFQYNPGSGINCSVSDSNGSVGGAGTSSGGGTFTLSATDSGAGVAFTVELCTSAAVSGAAQPVRARGATTPYVLGPPGLIYGKS